MEGVMKKKKAVKKISKDSICPHKNIRDEVVLGQKTGDYECLGCRQKFTPEEWSKFNRKN
jgi:hypothetical protein